MEKKFFSLMNSAGYDIPVLVENVYPSVYQFLYEERHCVLVLNSRIYHGYLLYEVYHKSNNIVPKSNDLIYDDNIFLSLSEKDITEIKIMKGDYNNWNILINGSFLIPVNEDMTYIATDLSLPILTSSPLQLDGRKIYELVFGGEE